MSRPVHYAASGTRALAFACFRRELRAHLDSYTPSGTTPRAGTYSVPPPRRHTDLRRVTCLECWQHIAAMAQTALTKENQL